MDNTYSISEVADKLGLSDKTLRRWEEAGRFASPRTLGNQRRYTIEDLQILDAIKHGTIPDQKDLLTREQAALLLNVSPVTVDRYVAEGKIHPFITVGNTFFPRHILEKKLGELKSHEPKEVITAPPKPLSTPKATETPALPAGRLEHQSTGIPPLAINLITTLLILTLYHFTFNNPSLPASPQPSGSVQGVSTISPQILNLLEDVLDPSGNITGATLTGKNGTITPTLSLTPSVAPLSPAPGPIYYDATSQVLKIYLNNSWVALATTTNLAQLNSNFDTQLSSISAQLENQTSTPSSQSR